jgi:molecular chaperone DnaJ
MNLKQAYQILGLPEGASPEEAKKQYKKLAKQYHPDLNKDPQAESKAKEINEAYQVVSTGKSTDREDSYMQQPFNPFGSMFGQQRMYNAQPITVRISISFAEAVFGCNKDIKFVRNCKCTSCGGQGEISVHNGCSTCGGKGQTMRQQGSMIFIQTCSTCGGKNKKEHCLPCKSKGIVEAEVSMRIAIPGGSNNSLNLQGKGHYIGSIGPLEQNGDVHLHVQVIPEAGLSIDGIHVVSGVELSLQEALEGCKKIVNTVNGYQDIEVPPRSRHKDEIILPKLGINGIGSQRVILDVRYPEDVSDIIGVLNKSLNYKVN